ncbi:YkoP family protein [Bacillus sp. AK128]
MSNVMKSWLLSIWYLLDPIYYSFTRLTYVQDDLKQNLIFRVRVTKYKGREVVLADGTVIRKNDRLLKIHLHNAKLLKELHEVQCEIKRGRHIFQAVLTALPALASYIEEHPEKDHLKAVIGITTLHRGCRRLGFETHDIKSKLYHLFKKATFIFIYILSATTLSRESMQKHQPKYLFMSTKDLSRRYRIE